MVPPARIRPLNAQPLRRDGQYVLYWMVAFRRLQSNFALEHAAALAADLGRPLVIFEPLRVDYRWACDRFHRFIIDGMADHARWLAGRRATYIPHVETARGEGRALFRALATEAAVIVTDDSPAFFLPAMTRRAAEWAPVRVDGVDANGLLPIRGRAKPFATAFSFRAAFQREFREHLPNWPGDVRWDALPTPQPLLFPDGTPPATELDVLASPDRLLATLPIDHAVGQTLLVGGATAARQQLGHFITSGLTRYAEDRNHPDLAATSGLSPYLHFGHLSTHEVFAAVMTAEHWTSRKLAATGGGRRDGWWGTSPSAEAFLDQVITWRELGLVTCATEPDAYDTYTSLPSWARHTLDAHASDTRPVLYSRDQLEHSATHDAVWNAAQREMVTQGAMHNYLRMLWGKKILEWSPAPAAALDTMIDLMNRHALDGRDPNSYTGYSWTLGRYDRPWAPARPIFGTIRYMSSTNTLKKLRMKTYLKRFAPTP